ncbi:cyclophilin-like fold protein [Streptomyces sp. NPDC017248]|uniref:cyclophilin-like fold protein n=1 Tax=unclassified Streptomyces TaxID=2593676 RepID=UPI0037AA5540
MHPTTRRVLAGTLPAAAFLFAVTACADGSPAGPRPAGPGATAPAGGREPSASAPPSAPPEKDPAMHIRLTLDDHPVEATLHDSRTARDFAALLPLTVTMRDFHRTERIGDPPRALDTSGAPDAVTPKAGDLAYYAPWGNLAFFYRDGEHSPGLVLLGRLDSSADLVRLARATSVRVEAAT